MGRVLSGLIIETGVAVCDSNGLSCVVLGGRWNGVEELSPDKIHGSSITALLWGRELVSGKYQSMLILVDCRRRCPHDALSEAIKA